ncbi:unnamed protein product [Cyprideis torosa]|uniref:Uncharacterized protein n=1 Tax=Cyprideis torosa TaxID=163714 RepID=A0A7R8WC35_9CRUS|nr:unnamed protein product [Cyprideis torosa]CAG0887638.1 unnamed protein product [Cyprideis torosa]
MDLLGIEFGEEARKRDACEVMDVNFSAVSCIEEHHMHCITRLWKDSGIQTCYEHRREFQLSDSAKYFFDGLARLAGQDYVVTDQDILRARVPTSGIFEENFQFDKILLRIIDVGGQRTERRKWIHCFENVTSIIYLVALSEYDQQLYENNGVNRMEESLKLFGTILCYPYFNSLYPIVFFNKKDILEEKIKTSHLADYYPEFKGPKCDAQAAQTFIKEMFLREYRTCDEKKDTPIFTHFTQATDTNSVLIDKIQGSVPSSVDIRYPLPMMHVYRVCSSAAPPSVHQPS